MFWQLTLGEGARIALCGDKPFIVMDGCHQECYRNHFESIGCKYEFHLLLVELGIVKDCDWELIVEEVHLGSRYNYCGKYTGIRKAASDALIGWGKDTLTSQNSSRMRS